MENTRKAFGSNPPVNKNRRVGAFWEKTSNFNSEVYYNGEIEVNQELLAALTNPDTNKKGNKVIRVSLMKNPTKTAQNNEPSYRLLLDKPKT